MTRGVGAAASELPGNNDEGRALRRLLARSAETVRELWRPSGRNARR